MKQVVINIVDTQINGIVEVIPGVPVPGGDIVFPFPAVENRAKRSSIVLSYEGADDKYQTLMTSSLTFDLLVKDGADGKFYHLFTGSESRYRVDLIAIIGDVIVQEQLLWRGFLLPDQYSEPYKSPAFFVSMTATDCLGVLKGKEFPDSYYKEKKSVIDYICTALRLTGLTQNLCLSPAIYPNNGYYFHEIFIDGNVYEKKEKEKEEKLEITSPERESVYDILEKIVHDLGCKLYSYKGRWYMVGINVQHVGVVSFYEYSSTGEYVGTLSEGRVPKKVTFLADPVVSVISPWRTVELTADYEFENDIIGTEYYEAITEDEKQPVMQKWKQVGNTGYFFLPRDGKWIYKSGVMSIAMPVILAASRWKTESTISGNYIEFRNPVWIEKPDYPAPINKKFLQVELDFISYTTVGTREKFEKDEYGDVMRFEIVHNNVVIASNFPGSSKYDASALEVTFSESGNSNHGKLNWVESRSHLKGRIKIDRLPVTMSGDLQFRLYPPVLKDNFNPAFNEVGFSTLKIKVICLKKFTAKKVRNIDYTTKKTIELFHIDSAQDNTLKKFTFKRGGLQEQRAHRQSWNRPGINENIRYGEAYARMIHDIQPKPHIKIEGTALGILSPLELYEFKWRENRVFIPTRLELNFSEGESEITMIENVYENVSNYKSTLD